MKQNALGGIATNMVWKVALVALLAPGVASAQSQDCQEDADCGHGFQCVHESAGTSSVTGVGGSSQAECGDGICEGGIEDVESCPRDCDTIQYCAPAECDSNSDCADGYECGEVQTNTSGFSSAGGSTGSVCGDGTCDLDESSASCAEDCLAYRQCQVVLKECTSDADCADGFYCDLELGVNGSSSVTVGTDTATNGSDSAADSSSGDTGGSGGTDSGFAPPADSSTTGGDETGICVVESSDSGGSTDVGTSGNNSVDAGATGPTDGGSATGGDESASSAANGAGGVSATAGNDSGTPAATGNDGDGTGSGADSGGAGGSDPDAGGEGKNDDDAGCSCAVLGVRGSSGLLAVVFFGLAVALRRRQK